MNFYSKITVTTTAILLLLLYYAQANILYDIIVAKDGSGHYRTIQEAINAVPDYRKAVTVIFIKKGVYKEKLILPESKPEVSFVGENEDSTILEFDDFASKKNVFGEELGTAATASFYIFAPGFSARNITFSNTSGPVGQALAIWIQGDRARFFNCRFLGFQDTIYTCHNRHYFNHCYIEGTVDFIFGSSTAVFDTCTIHCKNKGYITAANTPEKQQYGYVFRHCKITGNADTGTFDLGRPWRPFAKVVFLESDFGKHINARGWNNWGKPSNEQTAYFAEYRNTGAGASVKGRVPWSHQLTDIEAKAYTLSGILGNWDPFSDSVFVGLPARANAANAVVVKDTSFTVNNTYEKEKVAFPFITIARPVMPGGVLAAWNIPYTNTGNRNLLIDVFYPEAKVGKVYPGVLLIHGGGWKSGDRSQQIPMAQQLAANGFVAVVVEYRLSPEAKYPAGMNDLRAAVSWMRKHAAAYKLNVHKIAALGCSSGGQMAALLGTTNKIGIAYKGQDSLGSIQAVVDIDGILAFHHPESAEGEVAAQWLGGPYEERYPVWEAASPLSNVDNNTVPVLFINSSLPRFHAGRNDMIMKMKKRNIYSEVHELPDTPHPFWLFHPWFEPTVTITVNFLKKVFN